MCLTTVYPCCEALGPLTLFSTRLAIMILLSQESIDTMQPKLQENTFYLPIEDGVYFRNNQQTLILKGQDLYQWFEALEPYLNGDHTLEAITNDLEPEQQMMV